MAIYQLKSYICMWMKIACLFFSDGQQSADRDHSNVKKEGDVDH
ncbi:hypothetical protein [Dubosiella newyorkensis]